MVCRRLVSFLLLLFSTSYCYAHTPSPVCNESRRLIAVAVLDLHEACSIDSPRVSQGLHGHSVRLIQEVAPGWGVIETEDGYRGYAQLDHLIPDRPQWRTSPRLNRIASLAGLVYPEGSIERPPKMRLSYGSYLELAEPLEASDERWLQVELADGSCGWIQRGDVEPIRALTLQEMVERSRHFLGIPYIWGGTSSEGYDCSGYVQTMYRSMGLLLPRDAYLQAASPVLSPIETPEEPGDILFFGEERITHVGLYLGEGEFIHAGVRDHQPRVTLSHLDTTSYTYREARRLTQSLLPTTRP